MLLTSDSRTLQNAHKKSALPMNRTSEFMSKSDQHLLAIFCVVESNLLSPNEGGSLLI